MNYVFMRFPDFRDKCVTLSYDDGTYTDKKLIAIMDKNGLKGTFNINSGMFSQDGSWRMTRQQTLDLYLNSGHEVAIHGKMHLPLNKVPLSVATDDVLADRRALEEMFGTVITGMAYAYGKYDDASVEILKNCGVEYARTTKTTHKFDIPTDWLRLPTTCKHKDPDLMKLAQSFLEEAPAKTFWAQMPKLFYLWGHSWEFENNNNWNVIEEFAEYVGNREDVWYATNIEVYQYVKAFDSLRFSADGTMVNNPSGTDLYLNYYGTEILVEAGQTRNLPNGNLLLIL